MSELLCLLITVYLVVLVGRAVISWFPIRPDSPIAGLARVLVDVTEPVLAPVRRIVPPAGMLDLSFIVVFFLLVLLRSAICR